MHSRNTNDPLAFSNNFLQLLRLIIDGIDKGEGASRMVSPFNEGGFADDFEADLF